MSKKETLRGDVSVEKLEASKPGPRRFRMKAYSGKPVDRARGKVVFDVEKCSLPQKLPMLVNHDPEKVAGYADGYEKASDGLYLVGVLCSTPDGDRISKLSDEGFPLTGSIGIEAEDLKSIEHVAKGDEVQVNSLKLEGPIEVWRASHLFETSFITAGPADRSTSAVVLSDEERDVAKEELVAEAEKAAREKLKQFEDAFPHRPGFGAKAFLDGKTIEQAKLEDADLRVKDAEERAKVAEEKLKKTPAPQDRHPGIGFAGAERDGSQPKEDLSLLPPKERAEAEWKADPRVRECFSSVTALEAFYRVEERGYKNKPAIDRAADAILSASVGE
jgi:hypothetical protein